MSELVRVCPVCDAENAPHRPRCACGASLAGVDFALPRADDAPDVAPARIRNDVHGDVPIDAPADVSAEVPAEVPADALADALADVPADVPAHAPAEVRDDAPAARLCGYADCGQPNAAGATRCVYCNRPIEPKGGGTTGPSAPLDTRPLPAALRGAYRICEVLPATGSEADLLLVERVATRERAVVKLYRKGIEPDFHLLEILSESVGPSVVGMLAHGVSEGVAYEVLEYIPGGTLQAYLAEGPLAASDVRRIVDEIAAALRGIHAHRILHRDLKPDNVLVRSRMPLTLALTDFGIASLSAATQHFTSVARTTQYAAPEVLTGVLDEKSDCWSLGMIVLEAATGRHPFDGLTEQAMNHQLATRPVDVRGVIDDDLRRLCRGLLLRNPQRRWGGPEVARWLDGDPTLIASDDGDGAATLVAPYRLAGVDCDSAASLGLAMAAHWDDARRDLARGQITRWVESELHDYDLLRHLRDEQDDRGIDDDLRLLRVLRRLCPGLPPVWRGAPLTRATLLAAARRATDDDGDAQRWLDSILRDAVLEAFAEDAELAAMGAQWRAGRQRFVTAWQSAEQARSAQRDAAARTGNGSGPVDFDAAVYGAVSEADAPPAHLLSGPLLLVLNEPAYAAALRLELADAHARLAPSPAWFDAAAERARDDAAALLAARALLDLACADADAETKRQDGAARSRERAIAEARQALRTRVEALLFLAPEDDDIDADTALRLGEGFDALQAACADLQGYDLTADAQEPLRLLVDKLQVQGFGVQRALAQLERDRGVNAIFLTRERLSIGAVALVIALITRIAWVIAAVVAAGGLFVLYRWYVRFQSTDGVLAALRRFRLPARLFLRTPP